MALKLGTRGSALATWQAEWVAARLLQHGIDTELVPITTTGDKQQTTAIDGLGIQGVFTKEIQRALLDGRIDLAVHSLKDLPTAEIEGLALVAVPQRGPTSDVLISRQAVSSVFELPQGAIIGTGSLRRQAQLLHFRPDLQIQPIRGNVETRLHKLERGDFDAIVLAQAGLQRLGLEKHITCVLSQEIMLPAVGQGALAIEIRSDDKAVRTVAEKLNHADTFLAVLAEREMLKTLEAGCSAPVAAIAEVVANKLSLVARVIGCDGVDLIEAHDKISLSETAGCAEINEFTKSLARRLGQQVADTLLKRGAAEIIASARNRQ